MSYALVGSAGAVSTGTSGASVTPAWGTGESRTAGNLLILVVAAFGSGTLPSAPAGWSIAKQQANSTSDSASIFYKIAAGSDTAPTVGAVTSTILSARLYEFSGNAGSFPLDQTGSTSSTLVSGDAIYTTSLADATAGELIITASAVKPSVAGTESCLDSVAVNGVTAVSMTETNNNATSTTSHYCFGYGVTTVNTGVDRNEFTWNGTNPMASVMASFKLPGVLPNQPGVLSPPAFVNENGDNDTTGYDPDGSVSLNGTSGYVSLPTNATIDAISTDPTHAWTVEAWINPTTIQSFAGASDCAAIVTRAYPGSGNIPFTLGYGKITTADAGAGMGNSTGNQVWVGFYNGSWHTLPDPTALTAADAGTWIHYVGTWDGVGLTLYRNGVRVAVGVPTPGFTAASSSGQVTYIGRRWDTSGTVVYFNGKVDEVAVYPKALSETQVTSHFAAQKVRIDPTWTDISADVKSVQTQRGRTYELDAYQAGTATVVLDDATRKYDAANNNSIYNGGDLAHPWYRILPLRPIRIRAAANDLSNPDFEKALSGTDWVALTSATVAVEGFIQTLGSQFYGGAATTSLATTLTSTMSAGNSVVVAIKCGTGDSVTNVTDSHGNTYVKVGEFTLGGPVTSLWTCLTPTTLLSSGDTVTYTLATADTNMGVVITEYAGIKGGVDQVGWAGDNSGNATSGTVRAFSPTVQGNEIALGAFSVASNLTSPSTPSPAVLESQDPNQLVNLADQFLSSEGTPGFALGWFGPAKWTALLATFKSDYPAPVTGSRSLRVITAASTGSGVRSERVPMTWSRLEANGIVDYQVAEVRTSAWIYADSGTDVRFYLQELNASNTVVATSSIQTVTGASAAWTELSLDYTLTDATTTQVQVVFDVGSNATATFHVDAAAVKPVWPIFQGFVDAWPETWEPPDYATTTLTAADGFEPLTQAQIETTILAPVPVGSAYTQIPQLLNLAYWPGPSDNQTGMRYITYSNSTDITKEMASLDGSQGSDYALTVLQDVTNSELGSFFMGKNGAATFQDGLYRTNFITVMGYLGAFSDDDVKLDSGAMLEYADMTTSYDQQRIINDWTVSPDSSASPATDGRAISGDSIRRYLRRSSTRSTRLLNASDAQTQANGLISRTSTDVWGGQRVTPASVLRVETLVLQPLSNRLLWRQALQREISDLIYVERTPGGQGPGAGGSGLHDTFFIEQITWSMDVDTPWQVSWQLSPSSFSTGDHPFQLDVSPYDRLDGTHPLL